MSYNYKKTRDKIFKLVKTASFAPENKFTDTVWRHHILPVVEHSLALGMKLKADLEVLELAALLHDYSAILDFKYYEEHHLHSAEMAGVILEKEKFPVDKILQIKSCIINHRGSVTSNRRSAEEKILASADAMSHFSELADMFYLTYGVHKNKTEEGAKWLQGKLGRSWKKIIPEGKRMIRSDFETAKYLINKVLNK